jgi:hypothetical protein
LILSLKFQEFYASTQPLPQPFSITVFHTNSNILSIREEENHQIGETLTIKHNHLYANEW